MINNLIDQNLSGVPGIVVQSVLYTVLGGGMWGTLIPCIYGKSGDFGRLECPPLK